MAWSAQDLETIRGHSFLKAFEFLPEVESTNDPALAWAGPVPALFLAGRQHGGRGRRGRSWFAPEGSLAFSLVLDPTTYGLNRAQTPLLSLIAALGLSDAIAVVLPQASVQVKWPNDIHVDGKKVSGILVECRDPARVVVGIGINVNADLSRLPEEVRVRATSLSALGGTFGLVDILEGVLTWLQVRLLDQTRLNLTTAWETRCMLQDREITFRQGEQVFSGRCAGINAAGELLLNREGGQVALNAGVVESIRPV